jgi:hypothetical protein
MTEIRWTSHPARRRPADAALAIAVTATTAWAVLISLQSILLAALAVVVLTVATASFWLPTHYVIDDAGVSVARIGRFQRRSWQRLRTYSFGSNVVLLSPFTKPHLLDRFRGVVLLLDGAPVDALRASLAQRFASSSESQR